MDLVGAERAATVDPADIVEPLVHCVEGLREKYEFEAAFFSGGLAAVPRVRSALLGARCSFAIELGPDGAFVAHRGGAYLLHQRGYQEGLVVDVGQTSVKVSTISGTRKIHVRPQGKTGLAAASFVSQCIQMVEALSLPRAMVLALPCEVSDDCVVGECTYDWADDERIIPRMLLNLPSISEVMVLNDAELAAVSARQILENRYRGILVLTLGFGPGAALIEA